MTDGAAGGGATAAATELAGGDGALAGCEWPRVARTMTPTMESTPTSAPPTMTGTLLDCGGAVPTLAWPHDAAVLTGGVTPDPLCTCAASGAPTPGLTPSVRPIRSMSMFCVPVPKGAIASASSATLA